MKRKAWKQFMAAALSAAMAVGLAACGGNAATGTGATGATSVEESSAAESGAEESAPPEEESKYPIRTKADGSPIDLGGIEVVIGDWWSADEETEPANAYEEARVEFYDWAEETYHFTLKQAAISTWADMPEDFVNYATSGGDEHYIFVLRQSGELVSAMNSGLMYDLAALDCLDFSEAKWKSGIHELLSKNGAIYGMRGIDPEPRTGVFFNKRLLEEAGIAPEDLYDKQENGEWTWDAFEELCKQVQKDTDNDGVIDQYAMATQASYFYSAAIYSNNGEYVGKDDTGYFSRLESEETMEALNWAYRVRNTYEMVYPADSAWDYSYTAFANGEAVFCIDDAYNAGGKWSEMEDDFGFVCFPKGPKASDYTNCYTDNVYAIPACYDAEKAWNIAFVYDIYTSPIPGYEDYAAWKSDFYSSFRDTESVDLSLARMMENGMVTYHSMVAGIDLGNDFIWSLNEDNTPAQQAESIRNTWQAYLDEANQ
ncbi:MAG: extracellular solute-binding protein [Clostridium sp.]|nr:extracellular solute-binding protein [Clostridium sp.]